MGSTSSSKIGHDFIKQSGSKIEVRKNIFYKKWPPKLIFLNDFFSKKLHRFSTQKIDFESTMSALFDEPQFIAGLF